MLIRILLVAQVPKSDVQSGALNFENSILEKEFVDMKYPTKFRPEATHDLIRVGAKYDGGYVLPARILPATTGVLSFGLSDEFHFEKQVAQKCGAGVVCFDHSVNSLFWIRKFTANFVKGILGFNSVKIVRAFRFLGYKRFFDGKKHIHVRKALGYSRPGVVSFDEALQLSGFSHDIFLKMDIEGWEYRLLDSIIEKRALFSGMAIEFHDVDLHEDRICRFLDDIADHHTLVHLHANSHTTVGPNGMSIVVELTLMNRALLEPSEERSHHTLPIPGLDAPNLPSNKEAKVAFS